MTTLKPQSSIMNSLKPHEIIKLSANIKSKPVLKEKIGPAEFSIFCSSPLHEPVWSNESEHLLIKEARRTYQRYGKVPLIDPLDSKSAVYLTRTTYPVEINGKWENAEEWLSMRFVPASGDPLLTEDVIYEVIYDGQKQKPLLPHLAEIKGLKTKELVKGLVTHSRISAVRPYIINGDFLKSQQNKSEGHHLGKNRYTALSFALMNQAFFQDAAKLGKQFTTLTSLMHRELTDNILTIKEGIKLPFIDAAEALMLNKQETVRLDQSYPKIRFMYPGYFLNIHDLVRLLKTGLLPKEVLNTYLLHPTTIEEMLASPKMHHFSNMGQLFLTKGPISQTNLTGDQLRNNMNKYVRDGPVLRIMSVSAWLQGVKTMIEYCRK